GIFLLYLGIKIGMMSQTSQQGKKQLQERSAWHAFITTFFLTLSNPATILSFIAIFGGLGLGSTQIHYSGATFLLIGVLMGSALWWLILSSGVALILHHRISPNMMKIINGVSGCVILGFGVMAVLSGLLHPDFSLPFFH